MSNQEALVEGLLSRDKPSELDQIYIPEIKRLQSVPQDKRHHPEGNVLIHSLEVLDRAAEIKEFIPDPNDKLIYMLAAWLHDIGKDSHTFYRGEKRTDLTHWSKPRPENTRIVSYRHDYAGAKLVPVILIREIPGEYYHIIPDVKELVAHHMCPTLFKRASKKAFKKLRDRGVNLDLLGLLNWADKGRIPYYWFERIRSSG